MLTQFRCWKRLLEIGWRQTLSAWCIYGRSLVILLIFCTLAVAYANQHKPRYLTMLRTFMSRARVQLHANCGCYIVCPPCPRLDVTYEEGEGTTAACYCYPPCHFPIIFHPCNITRPDETHGGTPDNRVPRDNELDGESLHDESASRHDRAQSSSGRHEERPEDDSSSSPVAGPSRAAGRQTGCERNPGAYNPWERVKKFSRGSRSTRRYDDSLESEVRSKPKAKPAIKGAMLSKKYKDSEPRIVSRRGL